MVFFTGVTFALPIASILPFPVFVRLPFLSMYLPPLVPSTAAFPLLATVIGSAAVLLRMVSSNEFILLIAGDMSASTVMVFLALVPQRFMFSLIFFIASPTLPKFSAFEAMAE